VSSTLDTLGWGSSSLLRGDLAEEVGRLKRQAGKNIQISGSPRLVRSLLRDGLLDELSLMLVPIVVGCGMRLFDDMTDQVALELVESRALGTGMLSVTYQPASA
jgi:dihydrofolate reductase